MIISKTPLRASLFGGGSDFREYYKNGYGQVLSTAIDMYIYICVTKKFDDLIRVSYSTTELVNRVDDIKHNIFREALKIAGIEKGIDIVYMGDVPLGAGGVGLASSSATAVGALNALFTYKGQHVSAEFLAQKACEIEIEILKNPIGKQDQYAVAYGGMNTYRFNKDESVAVNPIICQRETKERINKNLMFFYTGVTRVSSTILEDQVKRIPDTTSYIDRLVEIVDIAKDCIVQNDISPMGTLLHESWQIKKKLSDAISNGEIDVYYEKALEAGAQGGKILGAGGGGFLMLYCEIEKQNHVRKVLKDSGFRETDILFESQGSKIIYVGD